MKTEKLPLTITESGVSARIRKHTKIKAGKKYDSFVVEYLLLGKRQQVWRTDLAEAKAVAKEACLSIANGQQTSLELNDYQRMAYVRAVEAVSPAHVPIDTACREYAEALKILAGKASIIEACREWVKRNAVALPQITVHAAVIQLERQAETDGKSNDRQKQLCAALYRLSDSFTGYVHTITPNLISSYLAALPFKERTKRNHRDVIGYFNRWLILRGYLAKGTDWLEGVQNYTARKLGEIQIYTPDEMKLLLNKADKRLVPFLAIGAFTGLRHAEIARLDWSEIELADGAGESFIEVRADKAKTQTRRLVPVKDNLKAWLMPYRKTAGKVCPFENTTKQLLKTAAVTGDAANKIEPLAWKKNALRHSCISYRIAECGDVPRVSDESGNSVQVIRSNYLRRVKPAVAAEWFSILPPRKTKTRKLVLTN
jgi:integrase